MHDAINEESQHRARGNVLAEWHQLHLVVMRDHLAFRRHQVRAIVKSELSIELRQRRRTEQNWDAAVARESQQLFSIRRIFGESSGISIVGLEQKRRRRLRPYDKIGAALGRNRRFLLIDLVTLRQKFRIPLE